MSWYEESPVWLAETVASVSRFCDHIVACDGAYALYPRGRGGSHPEQAQAIREAAAAVGIGCTVHVPSSRWEGNEVAKRSAMFRIASAIAGPDDWYLVIDADEMITAAPDDVRARLAETTCVVAEVSHSTYRGNIGGEHEPWSARPARRLFRALESLRVEGRHWDYVADIEGETVHLWGQGLGPIAAAEDMQGITMMHRSHLRPARRRKAARDYYLIRDQHGIEARPVVVEGLDGQLLEVAR